MARAKCICEICNCGRHHCKLHGRGSNPLGSGGQSEKDTEYKQRFPEHPVSKTQSMKPRQANVASDAPFDGVTTNRADFVQKPVEARRAKEKAKYAPPEGSMDMTTTNQQAYTGSKGAKQESYRPKETALQSGDRFDDATTSKGI